MAEPVIEYTGSAAGAPTVSGPSGGEPGGTGADILAKHKLIAYKGFFVKAAIVATICTMISAVAVLALSLHSSSSSP